MYNQFGQMNPYQSIPYNQFTRTEIVKVNGRGRHRGMTIAELLTKHEITQTQLSRRLGIPLRTVQDWARGVRTPPDWTVRLIEIALEKEDG